MPGWVYQYCQYCVTSAYWKIVYEKYYMRNKRCSGILQGITKTVAFRCSIKKPFLNIFQNLAKNTCVSVPF